MDANRYLVIGGDGLVGRAVADTLQACGSECVRTSRRQRGARESCVTEFDVKVDDPADIPNVFDVAFLCAAVTGFSICADNPAATREVNVERTAAIAGALARKGTFVVLPSTNAVFPQNAASTDEECQPWPDTEYGRQKYDAERAVLAAAGDARAAIVRLTKVIGPQSKLHDFLATLRRNHSARAFADVQLSPVTLPHAAQALAWVGRQRCSGLLHVSGLGSRSYASVAEDLAAEAADSGTAGPPVVEAISAPKSLAKHLYRPRRADLEMRSTVQRTPLRPQPLSDVIRYVSTGSIDEMSNHSSGEKTPR